MKVTGMRARLMCNNNGIVYKRGARVTSITQAHNRYYVKRI